MRKRIAITVGVNQYENASHINLRFARNDAEIIAKLLTDPQCGGFDLVHTLLDTEATKHKILSILRDVLLNSNLYNDDLVLFFFSGHGALDSGDNLFLISHDVKVKSDGSIDVTSAVHVKELQILLENTNVGNIVFMFDACHSGASSKLLGRIKYQDDQSRILIAASRFFSESSGITRI